MDKLEKIADFVLEAALTAGADTAQCTVRDSQDREFNVDGGDFSLMRTLFDRQVTLSVLQGHRHGSVTINRFDEDALRDAAAQCVASAAAAEPDEAREFAAGPLSGDFTQGAPAPDTAGFFDRVRELMDDTAARHPLLLMEQLVACHQHGRTVYKSTNGVTWRREAGAYNVSLTYSAHRGRESSSMYGGEFVTDRLDRPFIEMALIDREMGEVEAQLGARPVPEKFVGTALFAPGCLAGDVLGTAVANFASDASLIDGTALWREKLGQPVADPRISLTLAPWDDRIVCGQRWTGEGFPAADQPILENGVLSAFLLTQYAANKTGHRRAGNTSSSMIVPPGDTPLADIIAGIDRGVYLMRFSGGSPGAGGEFSGVAKNGFLIEHGRLTTPLTETMISGSLSELLLHLRGVSRELLEDGALSVPYMAFDGVTIS